MFCSQIFASASEFSAPSAFLEPLEGVRRSEESVALARKLFAPSVRHQKKPRHQRADEHIKFNAHNIWISGRSRKLRRELEGKISARERPQGKGGKHAT